MQQISLPRTQEKLVYFRGSYEFRHFIGHFLAASRQALDQGHQAFLGRGPFHCPRDHNEVSKALHVLRISSSLEAVVEKLEINHLIGGINLQQKNKRVSIIGQSACTSSNSGVKNSYQSAGIRSRGLQIEQ